MTKLKMEEYGQRTTSFTNLTWQGQTLKSKSTYQSKFVNWHHCISDSHRWPPRKGDRDLDLGGAFVTQSVEIINSPAFVSSMYPQVDHSGTWVQGEGYTHAYYADFKGGIQHCVPPSINSQLDSYGTSILAGMLPTNPYANLAQFFLELREGLPSIPAIKMWRSRAQYFLNLKKSAGNEYLNIEFGWKPFIKDILDFVSACYGAQKVLEQYIRDAGRTVRRRRSLPPIVTSTYLDMGRSYGTPGPLGLMCKSPGNLSRTVTTVTERWVSAAFRYYLPPKQQRKARLDRLTQKLFGSDLTPEVLWEVAPWSWAVDWVINVGDVVHNYVAFQNDGLVMKYGYVCEKITRTTTYTLTGAQFEGCTVSASQHIVAVTKSRRRATPYGFGLTPASFTARQWAIIAALGLSRAPRSLSF